MRPAPSLGAVTAAADAHADRARRGRGRVVGCCLIAGLLLVGAADAAASTVPLDVQTDARCVEAEPLRAALAPLLEGQTPARPGAVNVTVSPAGEAWRASLRVVGPAGEAQLERAFEVASVDCASLPGALATILELFLTEAPSAGWTAPATTVAPALVDVAATGALVGEAGPLGAGAELGVLVGAGTPSHRLTAGVGVRAVAPRGLGAGRYAQTSLLVSVGFRHQRATWALAAQLLSGPLAVTGFDYPEARRTWLPWLELQAQGLLRTGAVWMGLGLGAALSRHEVRAPSGEAARTAVPRLALLVLVPLVER